MSINRKSFLKIIELIAKIYSTAGGIAVSVASFKYKRGPDGKMYAIGGEVKMMMMKILCLILNKEALKNIPNRKRKKMKFLS